GSGCAVDQANALPDEREFADRAGADRSGGEERSGGGGGGGGGGRRRGGYPLGAENAGRGRGGVFWRGGGGEATRHGAWGAAGGAARGGRLDPTVRALGNGQLQSEHRAVLYGFEPADERAAHHVVGAPGVQLFDVVFGAGAVQPAFRGAAEPGEELRVADRPG